MINFFGKHHETLYISLSLLDRYCALHYLHTRRQKKILAATCAFLAIKFNEEFDPEIESTIKATPALSSIFAKRKEILAMERKVMLALKWKVRCVTPHIVAYKLLDAIPFSFSFGLKRYLVNIVERVCCNLVTNRQTHFVQPQRRGGLLRAMLMSALDTAFGLVFREDAATIFKEMARRLLGPEADNPPAFHNAEELNLAYASLPVVYGSSINITCI